jgi:hypothetical protein
MYGLDGTIILCSKYGYHIGLTMDGIGSAICKVLFTGAKCRVVRSKPTDVSEEPTASGTLLATSCCWINFLVCSSSLTVEATCSSETSVVILQNHRCENHKSYIT